MSSSSPTSLGKWFTDVVVPAAGQAEGETFSVATFNVLASCYCRSKTFPYAKKAVIKWKRRRELVAEVLQHCGADVLHLQEVDEFESWHSGILAKLGYDYVFCSRPSKQDGCVIAWKRDRFALVRLNKPAVATEIQSRHRQLSGTLAVRDRDMEIVTVTGLLGGVADMPPQQQESDDLKDTHGDSATTPIGADALHPPSDAASDHPSIPEDAVPERLQLGARVADLDCLQDDPSVPAHERPLTERRNIGMWVVLLDKRRLACLEQQEQNENEFNGTSTGSSPRDRFLRCILVAANTHLFWNPTYLDVKLAQIAVLFSRLQEFLQHHFPGVALGAAAGGGAGAQGGVQEAVKDSTWAFRVPLVFCGDLNSVPDDRCVVYRFIHEGRGAIAGRLNKWPERLNDQALADAIAEADSSAAATTNEEAAAGVEGGLIQGLEKGERPKLMMPHSLLAVVRWLRGMDYDVASFGKATDPTLDWDKIFERARQENRILVTHSSQLLRRKDVPPHIYVNPRSTAEDVFRYVVCRLQLLLDPLRLFRRCVLCNGNLELVSPEVWATLDGVPEHLRGGVDKMGNPCQFCRCTSCPSTYWWGVQTNKGVHKLLSLYFGTPSPNSELPAQPAKLTAAAPPSPVLSQDTHAAAASEDDAPPAKPLFLRKSSELSLDDSRDLDALSEADPAGPLPGTADAGQHQEPKLGLWDALSQEAWREAIQVELQRWVELVWPEVRQNPSAADSNSNCSSCEEKEDAQESAVIKDDGKDSGTTQNGNEDGGHGELLQLIYNDRWQELPISPEFVMRRVSHSSPDNEGYSKNDRNDDDIKLSGLLLRPNPSFNSNSAGPQSPLYPLLAASVNGGPGKGAAPEHLHLLESGGLSPVVYRPRRTAGQLAQLDLGVAKQSLRARTWTHGLAGLRSSYLGYRRANHADHGLTHPKEAAQGDILGRRYASKAGHEAAGVGNAEEGAADLQADGVVARGDVVESASAPASTPPQNEDKRLQLPASLVDAEPLWTNYTAGFQDTLDYIFAPEDRLKTVWQRPLPNQKQVRKETALPSTEWPSDHLLLMTVYRWQ